MIWGSCPPPPYQKAGYATEEPPQKKKKLSAIGFCILLDFSFTSSQTEASQKEPHTSTEANKTADAVTELTEQLQAIIPGMDMVFRGQYPPPPQQLPPDLIHNP